MADKSQEGDNVAYTEALSVITFHRLAANKALTPSS